MLADFFTKPLQGELFRFFRNIIMGYVSVTDLFNEDSKIKERVGKCEKEVILNTSEIPNDEREKKSNGTYVRTSQ